MTHSAIFRQGDALPSRVQSTKLARIVRFGPEHPNICDTMARVPPQSYCQRLHRPRGYDQFVTLQRRHFDVPPKIVGVGVLGRFPMKAFVETAIE